MTSHDATGALVSRCSELIDLPSVSGDEAAVEAYVLTAMPPSFSSIHNEDSVLVFAEASPTGRPLVVLAGHTDTVPIEDNLPSRRANDAIWGRGSADMKSGLAVMIEFAHWVDERRESLDAEYAFVFFGREEAGLCPLLPALSSLARLQAASLALVMEPTANAIEAGCQGSLTLQLEYAGVAAHSARPWKGRNAAHAGVLAVHHLAREEPNDVDIDGLVFREVANVTKITGGVASNVIPASCHVSVNVRYAPNCDAAQIEAVWRERFAGEHVTIATTNLPPAPVVVDHPFVERLREAGAGELRAKQGWTNTADFAAVGVPAINYGPGDPGLAHRRDEHVDIAALRQSYDTLVAFAQPR